CRPSTAAVTTAQRVWREAVIAPAMSMRCITVPPRMKPRGFASFGRTTLTISVADSDARLEIVANPNREARFAEVVGAADALSCGAHGRAAEDDVLPVLVE